MTVSGWTMASDSRQPDQKRESRTQGIRSVGRSRGFLVVRWRTPGWWRRARFSTASARCDRGAEIRVRRMMASMRLTLPGQSSNRKHAKVVGIRGRDRPTGCAPADPENRRIMNSTAGVGLAIGERPLFSRPTPGACPRARNTAPEPPSGLLHRVRPRNAGRDR